MPIEYCLGNVDPDARRRLRSRSDAREATCLDHCGRCHAGPFIVVDDDVVEGPTHEAILHATDRP